MKLEQMSLEKRRDDICDVDLELLQVLERERVLEVLQRDKALRTLDADRIRRLRFELHGFCHRNTETVTRPFGQRWCARCQRVLGKFWDCGSVCCGCSHRICDRCRVVRSARDWRCTVCHAYREFKIKSGEWFLEQQAKKFPDVKESSCETTGDKLLQSYHRLSFIAIVPPTPPPCYQAPSFSRAEELKTLKPFTKSMENLMASVSAHIKKLSKSQNDLREETGQLTVRHGLRNYSRRKSLSDGAINRALCKVPSLPILSHKSRSEERYTSSTTVYMSDDDTSHTSAYSDDQRDSNSSTGVDCGVLENTAVSGEIELAFAYSDRTSCLEITVKACKNLMFGDKKKKCHPYVKVCLLPKKQHSFKAKTTVKRGINPVYNETFTCAVGVEQLVSAVVQVCVCHSRGLKRRLFLGERLVALAELSLQDTHAPRAGCFTLARKGGDAESFTSDLTLKARFHFLPQTHLHTDGILMGTAGQLTLVISGLSKLFVNKSVFIEGILCCGEREQVQRSPALVKTDGSVQMSFGRLTRPELLQSRLTLNLCQKNSFSLADRILTSAQLDGESSWQRLQQMPGEWHDFVLPLHANVSTDMMS